MKATKAIKVVSTGLVPDHVSTWIARYNGQPATKDVIKALDADIEFLVCQMRIAHGNTAGSSAWLFGIPDAQGITAWQYDIKW